MDRGSARKTSAPIPHKPVADAGDGGRWGAIRRALAPVAEPVYETLTLFDLPFLQTIFLPFLLSFFFLAFAW